MVGFFYQWYADGKPIRGATQATLRLHKAQKGRKLRVRVTGKEYLIKRHALSAHTKKVRS